MKRFLIFGMIVSFGLLSWAALTRPAQAAETGQSLSAAHIERIQMNCGEAQTALSQLHASDGLLRVNRGQLYDSMSNKLMGPLNSRIALSRLDGVELVRITTDYQTQLSSFRQNYQTYEESMTDLLRIDCVERPVAFYDSVTDTRDKRQATHDSAMQLHETIEAYKSAFEEFVVTFEEADQ